VPILILMKRMQIWVPSYAVANLSVPIRERPA
jgi:hypothetical protein